MKQSLERVIKSLAPGSWFSGAHLFGKKGTNGPELEAGDLVNLATVIGTPSELDQMQGIKFKDVFSTWKRIALNGTNPNAAPEELDTWTYNEAEDSVHCTVNSVSTVGFISPNAYDHYTFEVDISSANGDDDAIGLCLAYVTEGTEAYSLCLYRQGSSNVQPAGPGPVMPFALIYQPGVPQYPGYDTNLRRVAGVVGNLTYADGVAIPPEGISTNGGHGDWNTMGVVRLKVIREGNLITCQTSKGRGDLTYDPLNSFVVDLNSSEDLRKFIKPSRVGFITYSQPNATFKSLLQPGVNDQIIDARDNSIWTYNGTTWSKAAFTAANAPVKEGRMYKNAITGSLYYVASGFNFIRLN